jgi:ABC-type branched-subunit amino acid transport system substrate-binding protein
VSVAIAPGTIFAGHRVESVVARGGMGVVYRATDLALERPVALKVMAPELAGDERFRARFLKEPRLAASLDHAHVVPIYGAGEEDGLLYLAMRFVEGSDLKTVLEREVGRERLLGILAQVAGALDAAHRRGLVHRDVKPANVLLDEDEHAYLTDFGITKRLVGDSAGATQTGQIVGTLDYIAPEQVRGEAVDGRSDGYSLACVLYEGLTGAPPFAGLGEAETLWAHMQNDPPPLADPALDAVLRRGLAKAPEDRYPTCTALTDAARAAIGDAGAAPTTASALRRGLLRRRHAILAAGSVLLAAAIAAGTVALTSGGGSERRPPLGSGVAALDAGSGRRASLTATATAPSNVAVGEGAVWVLSAEDGTVSRIDPRTRAVRRFRTRGVPTDIAAGGGALWIGNGGGRSGGNYTVSISRVDPRTGAITHTVRLPDKTGGAFTAFFNWGFADIAVGAGAVWAIDPDHTVSRIDLDTGRLAATFDVTADRIAAGREGVWFVREDAVTRIDPRTNRVAETIRLPTRSTSAIAVGAGKVWVTADQEGVVWRIEPGPSPVQSTIDVGVGVTYVAFGAGALWTANYLDGTVTRIDPRSGKVTAREPIAAAQSLAAGAGSAWVSTAGGNAAGTLPASACGELASGGVAAPDVLIASDLPLQGSGGARSRALADAIRLVLRRHGFRAGRYTVGYRSCDDSTAQTGNFEARRCAANASAYAVAERLVAVIGPFNSFCAVSQIPILNRAPGGPLAMISPTNTYPGFTRAGLPPPNGLRGEPAVYYPTGVHHYVRLLPPDDVLPVAHAVLARRLGLSGVYVLDDGSDFWKGLSSDPFRRAAKKLGLAIAGSAAFDPAAKSYAALADRVARSGADGVLLGGDVFLGGDRLLKALRARLGPRVAIMAGFLFENIPEVLKRAGRAARGLYVSNSDVPRAAFARNAAGRQFARDIGTDAQFVGALEAGQAAELVLRAIARSDGTRASVLEHLRASNVTDGILGTFRFDRNGDITTASVPILRIVGATPPGTGLPSEFQGAVVDRVVNVPARLMG